MAATSPASPPPTMVIVVMHERGVEPSEGSAPLENVDDFVRAAQRGDPLAMNRLLRELGPVVGPICGAIALDQGDDAMQETMIAVVRNLKSLREPAAVHGWARRIATREAFGWPRRTQRHRWKSATSRCRTRAGRARCATCSIAFARAAAILVLPTWRHDRSRGAAPCR